MPRPSVNRAGSRSQVSIDPTANRNPVTNLRREKIFEDFSAWVRKELKLQISEATMPPQVMNTALVAYGKFLFYSGLPKYVFAEVINATIDRFPSYRGFVGSAWQTLKKWSEAEPVERSMVMPAALFQAAISLCLLWAWPKHACALLLGFHGLLRPSEFLYLRRSDLVLPRDVLADEDICYVRIFHSKTSRFVLRQHARISDALTVKFLVSQFGCVPSNQLLFGCSPAMFRTRWNKLFRFFGVPTSEKLRGITPKSLRGSGASWMFHHTEDVERILWRGKWQSRRTLEHYLQDVMGQVLLTDLVQEKRVCIVESFGEGCRPIFLLGHVCKNWMRAKKLCLYLVFLSDADRSSIKSSRLSIAIMWSLQPVKLVHCSEKI